MMRFRAVAIAIAFSFSASGALAAGAFEIAIDVIRPRPGDYGVVPEEALVAPLSVQIENPLGAVVLSCSESAPGQSINCSSDDARLREAGKYRVVVTPTAKPTEGVWHQYIRLPKATTSVVIKGNASLRYGSGGLALGGAFVIADSPFGVGLSSSWLASRLPHVRNRNDALAFQLTNNSPKAVFIEGSGSWPYGRLFLKTPTGLERIRHGRDLCADLWSAIELPLEKGELVELREDLNGIYLVPGEYEYQVAFAENPIIKDESLKTIYVARYPFEIR